MQDRDRKLKSLAWLLAPLVVLLLLSTPALRAVGLVSLRLLLLGGVILLLASCLSGLGVAELLRLRDDLSDEDAACRERLARLAHQLEQVETAICQLRNGFRREQERAQGERSRAALEQRLRELKDAIARERAVLYSIAATRWQRRAEPLMRELTLFADDLDPADAEFLEPWVRSRLNRLNALRPVGMRLLARLRADSEALALSAGRTLADVLQRELAELEHLRAALLTLRNELVAWNRPREAAEPDPELLAQRLNSAIGKFRRRREQRGLG